MCGMLPLRCVLATGVEEVYILNREPLYWGGDASGLLRPADRSQDMCVMLLFLCVLATRTGAKVLS
jgi:hypothetical protein